MKPFERMRRGRPRRFLTPTATFPSRRGRGSSSRPRSPFRHAVRRALTQQYRDKAFFVILICTTSTAFQVGIEELHLKNTLVISCILVLFDLYVLRASKGSTLCFLRPSVFGLNYIYLSLALGALTFVLAQAARGFWFGTDIRFLMPGALTFVSDSVLLTKMSTTASRWTDGPVPIAFLAGLGAVVIVISDYRSSPAAWLLPDANPVKVAALLAATIATAAVGKATGFIFLPETTGGMFMLYLLHVIALRDGKVRISLYLAALAILTVLFAGDKRDALFLIVPIVFLEAIVRNRPSITPKIVAQTLLAIPVFVGLVFVATVVRDPKSAQADTIVDTVAAIPDYATAGFIWVRAAFDFELAYTYFHTFNAINYVLEERLTPLWGSTYAKPLFLLLPRDWIEWKPWGASHLYALRYDRAYRLAGGSWMVSMVGEAFLNFRIMGALVLALLLGVLDRVFQRLVLIRERPNFAAAAAALYFPVAFMNFARGSGLDTLVFMMVVAAGTALVASLALNYGKKGTPWRLPRAPRRLAAPAEEEERHE